MTTGQVFKPSPSLTDFVQLFYIFQSRRSPEVRRPQRVTPDGSFEININLRRCPSRNEPDGENFALPVSYLVNRASSHYFINQLRRASIVGRWVLCWLPIYPTTGSCCFVNRRDTHELKAGLSVDREAALLKSYRRGGPPWPP